MTDILLIGVEPELRSLIEERFGRDGRETLVAHDRHEALTQISGQEQGPHAVVIGTSVDQPVRLAQRIHRLHRESPIVVLSNHSDYPHVSRALQFTPFLGDDVSSHLNTDTAAVIRTIDDALIQGHQRRKFRSAISVMNEQLESFSAHRVSAIQYLDQVLDFAPVGVLALDQEGNVISCNHRAEAILEQRERQIIGTSLTKLFTDDAAQTLEALLTGEQSEDNQQSNTVLTRHTGSGTEQFVSVILAELPVGSNERGSLAILQEVTTQVASEREREAALRLRDEFLSLAAHELKTPLTSIKGFVDLIGRQFDDDQWDRTRIVRLHDQLQTQLIRLEFLITDLLDVSRIRQGRLDLRPTPTDLAALARSVAQRFLDAPDTTLEHNVIVTTQEPVNGYWDPDRLDQVVTNLLSNAVKYSPEGGDVCVSVYQENTRAILKVTDRGIGIEPDLQERLFQPFIRGERIANVPGTGLGLHITATIIEQHGGTISVESSPGKGTTFTVELPTSRPETECLDEPAKHTDIP